MEQHQKKIIKFDIWLGTLIFGQQKNAATITQFEITNGNRQNIQSTKARNIPGPCFPVFCFLKTPILLAFILFCIFLFFLFNVQVVSLSTTYLHQSMLSRASKVSPAPTNIYLAHATSPIRIIIFFFLETTTSCVYRFPNFSGRN